MAKAKQEILKKQDLNDLVDKLSDNNKTEGLLLINQLVFIIDTLEKLKEIVNKNGVLEDFKQGKQEFIRESTALKSYNTTMKTYNTTLSSLLKLIDTDKENQKQKNQNKNLNDLLLDFEFLYLGDPKIKQEYAKLINLDASKWRTINDNDKDYLKYVLSIFNQRENTNLTLDDIITKRFLDD